MRFGDFRSSKLGTQGEDELKHFSLHMNTASTETAGHHGSLRNGYIF